MRNEEQVLRIQRSMRLIQSKAEKISRNFMNKHRGVSSPGELSLLSLQPVLRDLQVVSYLKGIHLKNNLISFGNTPFSITIRRLAKLLNLEDSIDSIISTYNAMAFRQIQELDYSIRQQVSDGLQANTDDGISKALSNADNTVKTIFRTTSNAAFNASTYIADQDPAIQEILWGYEYSTAGDERVRPEHVAMDGVTRPKDDPIWDVWWPPNGYNCRCIVIALFEKPSKETDPKQVDGEEPVPDEGFRFNPALALNQI